VLIAFANRMHPYRALFALAAFAACTSSESPAGDPVVSHVERLEVPIWLNTRADVLFVIDNSPGMAQLTTKLAADMRRMMIAAEHQTILDGVPDIRVAVITSDLADQGALHGGRFLAEETRFGWEEVRNYDGALVDAIAPLAAVGAAGGAPRPFATLERALATPGFVRDDAVLEVILVTASDDTGTEEPAAVAAAIRAVKPADPSNIVVNAATACAPKSSPRVQALLAQFPNRSTQLPICSEDLAPLAELGYLYNASLGLPCFERPLGEPRDCAAWLEDARSDAQVTLPACADNSKRCWSVHTPSRCLDGLPEIGLPYTPFGATAVLECVSATE
jgi:hypothetical protein